MEDSRELVGEAGQPPSQTIDEAADEAAAEASVAKGVESETHDATLQPTKKPPYRRAWFWVVAVMLIGVAAIAYLWFQATDPVPDVAGLSKAEAVSRIEATGVFTCELVYDESSTAPTGTVVAQEPSAWKRVSGGVLVVTISGPESIPVPDLRGETLEQATAILRSVGLEVAEVRELRNILHENLVVFSQSPEPGKRVEYRSNASLALAPREVEVPSLVEWDDSVAEELESSGLRLGEVRGVVSPNTVSGFILSQTPAAWRYVPYDTVVAIEVAVRPPLEHQILGEWKRIDSFDRDWGRNTATWTFLNDYSFINAVGQTSTWSLIQHDTIVLHPFPQAFRLERDGKYLNVWDPPNASKPTRRYELVKEVEPFPPDPELPGDSQ